MFLLLILLVLTHSDGSIVRVGTSINVRVTLAARDAGLLFDHLILVTTNSSINGTLGLLLFVALFTEL